LKKETTKSVADSLEVKRKLLRHMPYLLQDLWALGSSVDQILKVISGLNLPAINTRVLDLGCGKGAVSIKIAEKFGCNVLGVDAMKEFLYTAREKSVEFNVANKCRFIERDISEFIKEKKNYDLVILASLGGVFGSNLNTIEALRSQVKSGGYIIIDDGYAKRKTKLYRKGYSHYQSFDDTVLDLTKFGDTVISTVSTSEESVEINKFYSENLQKRITELEILFPEIKNDLHTYYSQQIEECNYLEKEVEGIIWLIRKK